MFYQVKNGTPGLVRKPGGFWTQHKARKDLLFTEAECRPWKGGYLVFARGGWEFMVFGGHVNGGYNPIKDDVLRQEPTMTFNRRVLRKNGAGSSRRRARAFQRKHKSR